MPKLSLWKEGKHTNDYRFFDRIILEQFQVGSTGIFIHKYLGPASQGGAIKASAAQTTISDTVTFADTTSVLPGMFASSSVLPPNTTVIAKDASAITFSNPTVSPANVGTDFTFYTDATRPTYTNQSEMNIQDLLFMENRDRKYDENVYVMRGHYRLNDVDFDMSQFGLFLTNDTIFMTVHLNNMIDTIGRKLMVGDVVELPHLTDYYPLDDQLQAALKRFYVVQDATKASEGFSPTWWPHLWRIKLQPMVDAQEFKDILNNVPAGIDSQTNQPYSTPVSDILSTFQEYLNINDQVVEQAEIDVPESGYDTTPFYVNTSNVQLTATQTLLSIEPSNKIDGYLTGDGLTPNGAPTNAGIAFPSNPSVGDFFLRLDFIPNRLFRFAGKRWMKVEDKVRTPLTAGKSQNQINTFINNEHITYAGEVGWDIIKVADPYTIQANSITQSFSVGSGTVTTTFAYQASYGVKTALNGVIINTPSRNFGGNLGFYVTSVIGDTIEYSVYQRMVNEKQGLSQALRPTSDN